MVNKAGGESICRQYPELNRTPKFDFISAPRNCRARNLFVPVNRV